MKPEGPKEDSAPRPKDDFAPRPKDDFAHRRRYFPYFSRNFLAVRPKGGMEAAFALNRAQLELDFALRRQREETGRVRAVVLKGRQQGISTYVAGRFYWRLIHGFGLSGFILTHLDASTRALFEIMRRFHDRCPGHAKPRARLNAREISFPGLGSACQIGTARAQGVGRGRTIQLFHGSEVAFWPDAREHIAGILQAVPDAEGTEVVLESTSSGPAGAFHDICRAAQAGEGDYAFHFLPWYWQGEYRKRYPQGFEPSYEEAQMAAQHGLDYTQIFWRRRKITELGSLETFRREYPMTVEEAFRADNPAALWSRGLIERNRRPLPAGIRRTVVAVDPAVSSHADSDETGIVVAALGEDGHGYVLADLSGRYTPGQWASVVHKAFAQYGADRVVAEVNQGGALVEHTLRTLDDRLPIKGVHATRGKAARAEPVAALDERGKVHHVGVFGMLEDQMCAFEPGAYRRCDRVDARVWALTELMLGRPQGSGPAAWG